MTQSIYTYDNYDLTQGEGGWFDKQGEILFDYWRKGKGKELFLSDNEVWGNGSAKEKLMEL